MTRPTITPQHERERRLRAAHDAARKLQAEFNELAGWFPGHVECAAHYMENVEASLSCAIDEMEDDRAYFDTWGHEKGHTI